MKISTSLIVLATVAMGRPQTSCVPPPVSVEIKAFPAGTIIDRVGTSDIPVTTESEKARQLTKQGFALIHCFWFNEAARSFRDATKADPTCAIAWMGRYASLTLPWYSPSTTQAEADYAIKRAVETCGDAGDLEQALIAAYRVRSTSKQDLDGEFERAMRRVIDDHPDAIEPRLLLAGIRTQICMSDYDAKLDPRSELTKVLALVQPILAKEPNNPGALHYRIHALEGSQPELAIDTAARLSKNAPASGHMVHMPGHIYNRVGMYEEARQSFMESVRIHEAYAKQIPGANPDIDWNYAHDLDYLIFNLAEMGRLREAKTMLAKNPSSWLRVAWRAADWNTCAKKSPSPYFTGMADVLRGDLAGASQEAGKLEKEAKAPMPSNPSRWQVTALRTAQVKAAELRGLILSRQGKHAEAIAKLAESVAVYRKLRYDEPAEYVRPPYETQGMVALAAGKPEAALRAYENGLRDRPNSGWMLFGIAEAQAAAGRVPEATEAYRTFLKAWETADPDLPQVVAAKAYLAAH